MFTYETTGTPGFCFFNFLTSSPVIDEDKDESSDDQKADDSENEEESKE